MIFKMNELNGSSNYSRPTSVGTDDTHFENIIRKVVIILYVLTILASVSMNSIVLLAVYLDKSLHNPNKYFVACLALSDFLVAVFSVTMRLHQVVKPGVPLNIHMCRFWIWVDIFTELASITTLTTISIDRYFKVGKPFKYKSLMSTKRCQKIIFSLWLYSAVVGSLGLIPYGSSKGVHITANGVCVNDNKYFFTVAAFIGFFVPVIVLLVMSAFLFRIVRKFRLSRSVKSQESQLVPRVHGKEVTNSNRRTVAIFGLVLFAFIVCWGPFFSLFLINQYNKNLLSLSQKGREILFMICFHILPYMNSFLNPIIYAYFDNSFNQAIKKMLLGMIGKESARGQSRSDSREPFARYTSKRKDVEDHNTIQLTIQLTNNELS